MKNFALYIALFFGVMIPATAQNMTTLTGTLTDSDSQQWALASWTARVVSQTGSCNFIDGTPVPASSGTLSSSGVFSGTVGITSRMVPTGCTYTFTVQSLTSASPSIVTNVTTTASTTNMGAHLSPLVTAPRIPASKLVYAYNTTEILDAVNGSGYNNTASNTGWLFNGSTWTQISGGSTGALFPATDGIVCNTSTTASVNCVASNVDALGLLTNSTTGNAGTATQLAATPSQCPGSSPYATGITANGTPNCVGFASIGITDGAIADYNFLQIAGSPSVLKDYSGNGNDGTLAAGANAPTWTTTGLFFNCATCGATGKSVSLPPALNSAKTFIFVTLDVPLPSEQVASNGYNMLLTPTVGTDTALLDWKITLTTDTTSQLANSLTIAKSGSLASISAQTDNGFHCRAYTLGTGGGDNDHLYIDGIEQQYQAQGASYSPLSSGHFFLGASLISPFDIPGYFGTMYRAIIYNTELSQSQIQSTCGGMFGDVSSRGVSTSPVIINGATAQLQAIGDSITCGFAGGSCQANTPYPSLLSLTNQPSYTITNWGNPGAPLQSMAAQEQFRVAPRCYSTSGVSIATVLAGINDIMFNVPTTPSSLLPYLYTEVQALKAGGCKVYVGTLISNAQNAASGGTADASLEAYDSLIRQQWKSIGAEGVIDFAANPNMGAAGAASNTTYFETDGVHPTQTGQQQMANAMSNTLNFHAGYNAGNPHIYTSTTTLASGDGGVMVGSISGSTAFTMPDCTGPTGVVYSINNPQAAFPVTVIGGTSQPINGLATAISIPSNSTASLTDVANGGTAAGCHWSMLITGQGDGTVTQTDVTGSRVFNTTYQNTGTTNLYITGIGVIGGTGTLAASLTPFDGTVTASKELSVQQVNGLLPGNNIGFQAIIPPSYFYEVVSTISAGGTLAVGSWIETTVP